MSSVFLQPNNSINSYCAGRTAKKLHNEYKKFIESPPENIEVAFQEDRILEWHFLFTGLNGTPFEGGQYHGTLIFPEDYPFSPPSIRFITPNGRFKTDERVCFALSDFHPEYWKPAYTVSAVLQGVYSFMMTETTDTVGSLAVDKNVVTNLAPKSKDFNRKDKICNELFHNQFIFNPDCTGLFSNSEIAHTSENKPGYLDEHNDLSKSRANNETADTVGFLVMNEKEIREFAGKNIDGSAELFQNEIRDALTVNSDVDADITLLQKSQAHSSDILDPTVSFKEVKTTETIDAVGNLVKNEKKRKQIAQKKRKCNLKDCSANLLQNEIKVIIPKLSDADTNPPLKKKSKKTDYPLAKKNDNNSSPETLERNVQYCESKGDGKVSIIPAPLPDEQNKCSEIDPILKEHGNIRTRSLTAETTPLLSSGASKKENLTAKSSSGKGKGKFDKYKSTAKYKPKTKDQFSTKSSQQSSPFSKGCLDPNESASKQSLSEGDKIKAKSTELLKGSKLVNPSLKSIYTKSPFDIK